MYRTIDCATWGDPWFEELRPNAKLLFLYLITTQRQTACGAFEVSHKTLAYETGLCRDDLNDILSELGARVIWWPDLSIIFVVNFYKHQRAASSDKFRVSAVKALQIFPQKVRTAVLKVYPELGSPKHTPPIPNAYPTDRVSTKTEQNRTETKQNKEEKPSADAEEVSAFSEFVSQVIAGYPKNSSGRRPTRKIAERALKRITVKDRPDFLASLTHYAVEDKVQRGYVMDIGRYVKDEWITYTVPAEERVAPTDSRLTRVPPNGRQPLDIAKYQPGGKYGPLFTKQPPTKADPK